MYLPARRPGQGPDGCDVRLDYTRCGSALASRPPPKEAFSMSTTAAHSQNELFESLPVPVALRRMIVPAARCV